MTGAVLIIGGLIMCFRPQSVSFSLLEGRLSWPSGTLVGLNILGMEACGMILVVARRTSDVLYLILTVPLPAFAVLQIMGASLNPQASLESAYLIMAFHLVLQWAHNRLSLLQSLIKKLTSK